MLLTFPEIHSSLSITSKCFYYYYCILFVVLTVVSIISLIDIYDIRQVTKFNLFCKNLEKNVYFCKLSFFRSMLSRILDSGNYTCQIRDLTAYSITCCYYSEFRCKTFPPSTATETKTQNALYSNMMNEH